MTDQLLANAYIFPMWPRKEFKLRLKDILTVIEGEGLDWTMHWVYVFSPPPSRWISRSVHDFEKLTKTPEGVKISWEELCEWANSMGDLQDIELTGRLKARDVLKGRELGELVYFIEGYDSTVWTIKSKAVTDVSTLITPS